MASKRLTPRAKPKSKVKSKPPTPAARRRSPPMHAAKVPLPVDADHAGPNEAFEIFKSFDRDGSASIDRGELARLLEALGQHLDDEELDVAHTAIDSNASGKISWVEFEAWWSGR